MANFVNYHHFKTLLNAYERAYPEKNKNASQNAVAEIWKNMKKDYSSSGKKDIHNQQGGSAIDFVT